VVIRAQVVVLALVCTVVSPAARAQSDDELAGQVVNPFTSMVKVPVQISYEERPGRKAAASTGLFLHNHAPLFEAREVAGCA
jgi:hypothetical protein